MAFASTYHDSDADDEYERSVMTSPILPTDDDTSATDSDPPSTEPTPTTFGYSMDNFKQLSPSNTILSWTSNQCADYISSLGLHQYCDRFLENEVVGEALIALRHEELKEMGILSVGHRLTMLKGVYDIKMKQGIPMDPDHWMPPSADANAQEQLASRDDISRVIKSMELRDQKILTLEASLNKITEEYRKLREEVLPMIRMMKDRSQPLPLDPGGQSPDHVVDVDGRSPYGQNNQLPEHSKGLSRKFSTKRLFLGGGTPKSSSPTHAIPQSIPEGRTRADNSNLDPSPAAITASNNIFPSSLSPNQPNVPSPTSPIYSNQNALGDRKFRDIQPQSMISTANSNYISDRVNPTPTPIASGRNLRQYPPQPDKDEPPPSAGGAGGRDAPSVEIFKSFRVSMEDPCEKVLPAALKKYNINADWKNYALYIVYGDQERCLGLKEKPLILFKQLDKEGRKPMFMLRRHAAPLEGHSGPSGGGTLGGGGIGGGMGSGYDPLGGGRGHQSSIQLPQLPGGVL